MAPFPVVRSMDFLVVIFVNESLILSFLKHAKILARFRGYRATLVAVNICSSQRVIAQGSESKV
jgi:hypothetical protein